MAPSSVVSDRRSDFLTQLEKWKVKAEFGGEYVQLEKLERWMCGNSYSNIYELLYHQIQHDKFSLGGDTIKNMLEGPRRCVLVFSILLELDEGRLIQHLKEKKVYDSKLPMGLLQVQQAFEKSTKDGRKIKNPDKLAKKFHDLQWKYCPLQFEMGEEDHDNFAKQVIPICAMNHIKDGGTAQLYQVVVPREFVNQPLRDAVPNSLYDDVVHGPCYVFALKKFKDGNETMYHNEYRAFRALKDNDGMIRCLFGFSQLKQKHGSSKSGDPGRVDDSAGLNFYLLLEYGELDLWDYFGSHLPPVLEKEQLNFWSDLFLVVDAIKDIHSFKFSTIKGVKDYYGWHADIKPDNILNVGGEFKLADPGFARFEERSQDRCARVSTRYFGGTTEFGAPECYIAHRKPDPLNSIQVRREIDIWSLGCVFSVAATWMVFGPAGLEQFDTMRRQAIQEIVESRHSSHPLENGDQKESHLGLGGHFHDGENVLQAVREWHNFLRHGKRKNDVMTEEVVKIVEEDMLRSNPDQRRSAEFLCEQLKGVIQAAVVISPVQHSVQQALYKTEENWKKKTEEEARNAEVERLNTISSRSEFRFQQLQSNLGRTASRLLTGTLQTSHRSKAAPGGPSSKMSPPRILLTQSSHRVHSAVALQSIPDGRPLTPGPKDPAPISESFDESSKSSTVITDQYVATPSMTRTSTLTSRTPQSPRMIERLRSMTGRLKKFKPDEKLKRLYHDRDLIFVVDNGASMIELWDDVKVVLERLVAKAKGVNKSGMGLQFCIGETTFSPSKDPKVFVRELDKPEHIPLPEQYTNMGLVLGKIFQDYLDRFDDANKIREKMRNRTLIVLTDGIWGAMNDSEAVEKAIIEFNKRLRTKIRNFLGGEERRLSIQFVQFGNDRGATRRLRRLDTQLKHDNDPDIVDHKTSDVDPTKILISAVDESEDEDEYEEDGDDGVDDLRQSLSPMQSPTATGSQMLSP